MTIYTFDGKFKSSNECRIAEYNFIEQNDLFARGEISGYVYYEEHGYDQWIRETVIDSVEDNDGYDGYIYRVLRPREGVDAGSDGRFETDVNADQGQSLTFEAGIPFVASRLRGREDADLSDNLTGNSGDDLIYGYGGNDTLRGRDGKDSIWGGDGDDVLYGGNGNDFLRGGEYGKHTKDGNDTLYGEAGQDVLIGGGDADYLHGGRHNDYLDGGAGHDRQRGGIGNDYLDGGHGDDVLFGDNHHDFLDGSWGDDTLIGGRGNDLLTGSWGGDTFVFKRNSGHDVITDMNIHEDYGSYEDEKGDWVFPSRDTLRFKDMTLDDLKFLHNGREVDFDTGAKNSVTKIGWWNEPNVRRIGPDWENIKYIDTCEDYEAVEEAFQAGEQLSSSDIVERYTYPCPIYGAKWIFDNSITFPSVAELSLDHFEFV